MNKYVLAILAFVVASTGVWAQTVINDLHAEKRNVSGFTGIEVATGIRLTLTPGNTEEVAVSAAEPAFRDLIVTRVENGILKIYVEDKKNAINTRHIKKELKAYVSYKTLEKLEASTGAVVEIDGVLTTPAIKMNASTGAKINGKINSKDLVVDQQTGSVINLEGNTEKLKVEGSTGSKFECAELVTGHCDVKVSTGARVWITAKQQLSANANTGGNVKYKGDPAVKDFTKSTGGTVSKI